MSEKVSRNKIMRQQDFVDVATRLLSWQKGLFVEMYDVNESSARDLGVVQ